MCVCKELTLILRVLSVDKWAKDIDDLFTNTWSISVLGISVRVVNKKKSKHNFCPPGVLSMKNAHTKHRHKYLQLC